MLEARENELRVVAPCNLLPCFVDSIERDSAVGGWAKLLASFFSFPAFVKPPETVEREKLTFFVVSSTVVAVMDPRI
jgi:hypothetical protein